MIKEILKYLISPMDDGFLSPVPRIVLVISIILTFWYIIVLSY